MLMARPALVEFDDAVAFGIVHRIGEDRRAALQCCGAAAAAREIDWP